MPGLLFFCIAIAFLIASSVEAKPDQRKLFRWIGLIALGVGIICVVFGITPAH